MEVNCDTHAQAALPRGTEPLVYIEEEAGWATQPVRTFGRIENLLKLPGFEVWTVQ
jgi:hypothetical protein